MRELRFDKTVYDGAAVERAVEVYAGYANVTRADDDRAWVVRVDASTPARERAVAGELGNYAFGLAAGDRAGVP